MLKLIKRSSAGVIDIEKEPNYYECQVYDVYGLNITYGVYAIDIEYNDTLLTPIVRIIYFTIDDTKKDEKCLTIDNLDEIILELSKDGDTLRVKLEAIENPSKKRNPLQANIKNDDNDVVTYSIIYGIKGSKKFSISSDIKFANSKVSEARKIASKLTNDIEIDEDSFEDVSDNYMARITETKLPKQLLLIFESLHDTKTLVGDIEHFEKKLIYKAPKNKLIQPVRKFQSDARVINPFRMGFNLNNKFKVVSLRDQFRKTETPLKLVLSSLYNDATNPDTQRFEEPFSLCVYLDERIQTSKLSQDYTLCTLKNYYLQFNISFHAREEMFLIKVQDVLAHVFGSAWQTLHNKMINDLCSEKSKQENFVMHIDTLTTNRSTRQRTAVTLYNMLYTSYKINALITDNYPPPSFFADLIWRRIDVYTQVNSQKFYWLPMFVTGYRITAVRVQPTQLVMSTDIQLTLKAPYSYIRPANIPGK